ncbi:unnamed protein product [Closterium sp. Naga37s-1]|nr:unnamed protein product [Closterium sp. Naga37s-1]
MRQPHPQPGRCDHEGAAEHRRGVAGPAAVPESQLPPPKGGCQAGSQGKAYGAVVRPASVSSLIPADQLLASTKCRPDHYPKLGPATTIDTLPSLASPPRTSPPLLSPSLPSPPLPSPPLSSPPLCVPAASLLLPSSHTMAVPKPARGTVGKWQHALQGPREGSACAPTLNPTMPLTGSATASAASSAKADACLLCAGETHGIFVQMPSARSGRIACGVPKDRGGVCATAPTAVLLIPAMELSAVATSRVAVARNGQAVCE